MTDSEAAPDLWIQVRDPSDLPGVEHCARRWTWNRADQLVPTSDLVTGTSDTVRTEMARRGKLFLELSADEPDEQIVGVWV